MIQLKTNIRLFFIIVSLISNSNSQLEFSMKQIPIKDPFEFPIKSFTTVPDEKTENTLRIEGTTLLEMTRMMDGLYTIKLALGTPSQEFEVIVDTGSFMLWITSSHCHNCSNIKNKLNVDESTSLVKSDLRLQVKYITGKIIGEVCFEKLNVGGITTLPKFKFLLTDHVEIPIKTDGILGLTKVYKSYDPTYSLIDSLFREGIIKKKIFSQKIEDNEIDSKLTIGTMPKEIQDDLGNFTKCQTVKSYWACNVKQAFIIKDPKNSIFYANNPKKVIEFTSKTTPALFDTGSNVVVAPREYFDFFKNVYFKNMIDAKLCSCLTDREGATAFECSSMTNLNYLPKLVFVLDNNFTYEIDIAYFFIKSGNRRLFRMVFADLPEKVWLFGQPFLRQYHLVFDQEDHTIGFYPKKNGGIVMNTIMSLSEFEFEYDYKNSDYNLFIYLGIFYVCGLIFSLLIVFIIKIFNKIFRKREKNSELEKERNISLISTEGDINSI